VLEESVYVVTIHNRNLDRLVLTAAGQQEAVSVGALVGAALAQFSDSYARTRIRELRARGLLEQEGPGGPYRLTAVGRTELERLHATEEREAAA
jgi:hypothetical protein